MFALLALAARVLGSRAGLAIAGTAAALDIGPFGAGDDRPRRRRRKRALNSNDREDIAFMASFMTKAGLERAVAVMLAR